MARKSTLERVYDDPASYHYEKLDPADVVTPEDARRRLAPFLARAIALHEADTWAGSQLTIPGGYVS